jgi:hypothetical protein
VRAVVSETEMTQTQDRIRNIESNSTL